MLGGRGSQRGEAESGGNRHREHLTAEGCQSSSSATHRDPQRPQEKHGRRHPAGTNQRDHRRDNIAHRGDVDGLVAATNRPRRFDGETMTGAISETSDTYETTNATRTEGRCEGEGRRLTRGKQTGVGNRQDEQPVRSEGPGAEEEPDKGKPPGAPLSKEAAFLKVAEDTDGGQGAMLFSEFVEALTRLCLARYIPRAAARTQRLGTAAAASGAPSDTATAAAFAKTGGGRKIGVGGRKTTTTSRISLAARPVARGRSPNVRRCSNFAVGCRHKLSHEI